MKIKLIHGLPDNKEIVSQYTRPDRVRIPLMLDEQSDIVWVFEYKYSRSGRQYLYYSLSSITPYVKKKYIIDKMLGEE